MFEIKKYFWNILSIVLIIVVAESTLYYQKIKSSQKYKVIKQLNVELNCIFQKKYSHLEMGFCRRYNTTMLDPLKSYITSYYSLIEKETSNKIEGNKIFFKANINLENNEKLNKFNKEEFETYIYNLSNKFLERLKILHINKYIELQIDTTTGDYIALDNVNNLGNSELQNLRAKLSKTYSENNNKIQKIINEIEDIKINDVYKLNYEYSIKKEIIKTKFSRLTYPNVLLISFVFAIFINIIITVLIQNNLLKK